DGENTVPGAIELHLIFFFTKSAAIDFVKPITAPLVVPYTNLFGNPFKLEAQEETFTMLPLFCLIINGKI
mgnify:CR=1